MDRRHSCDLHRIFGHAFQCVGAGVVARDGSAPLAHPDSGRDVEVLGPSAGRDSVVGEARVRFDGALQRNDGVFGAGAPGVRKHRLANLQRLVSCEHQTAAVLSTVICLNRAGGQPWLTAFVWPGSPLPSADVPQSR
jgi:hypothetical protein